MNNDNIIEIRCCFIRRFICDSYQKIVILGSFSKHYDLIVEVAKKITEYEGWLPLEVISPRLKGIRDYNQDYILLEGDDINNPRELEKDFIENCLDADAIYVCDKDGYIGLSVAYELGFLSAYKKEVFFYEEPKDELIKSIMIEYTVKNPEDFCSTLSFRNLLIQHYYDGYMDVPFDKTYSLFQQPIPNGLNATCDYLDQKNGWGIVKKN